MKFCQYCGKQLADNEECTCQQNAAQGQQYNTAQNQYAGQNQQSKENEAINDITKLVKGILDTPVAAVSEFVKKSNITASVILIGIYSVIELVLALISIAHTSIRTAVYSLGYSHISIGTVFSTIFSYVGCEIIQVLIMAVVIMVVLNAMQKNKKVSFAQTLSVACLYNIVYLPIVLIANVVGLIPFNLFGHIDNWIVSFAAAIGYVYTFFGIREIEEDDNKMPIVFGLATVASAVCSTVVGLIL